MTDNIFLFDLDSTLTKQEILPEIAKEIGKEKEMRALTEETMQGAIPFKQSFLRRVDILKTVPVSKVSNIVRNIMLNDRLISFLRKNKDRCYVVTGNLDVWINPLITDMGMENHCFCSKAIAKDDMLIRVASVLDKEKTVKQLSAPFVSVGDGNNDADMARHAKVAIGYGGVRDIAPALMKTIDFAFFNEERLVGFLEKLL